MGFWSRIVPDIALSDKSEYYLYEKSKKDISQIDIDKDVETITNTKYESKPYSDALIFFTATILLIFIFFLFIRRKLFRKPS